MQDDDDDDDRDRDRHSGATSSESESERLVRCSGMDTHRRFLLSDLSRMRCITEVPVFGKFPQHPTYEIETVDDQNS